MARIRARRSAIKVTLKPSGEGRPGVVAAGHGGGNSEALRFERRRAPRHAESGAFTAMFNDDQGRIGLTSVELVDFSSGGLGLRSASRLEPGMTVTLWSPGTALPWRSGVVVRTTNERDGEVRAGLRVFTRSRAA
ncbi:MAG: PilZ domain-containing protein [Phycisphaerae bacterium]|nr:PilZ domain-containing protein [Phycisphaerae bacterium]